MMKAFVFENAGKFGLRSIPKPKLNNSKSVILKMTSTTICGTDLHILKGDVPESIASNGLVKPGNILENKGLVLGHEGIGKIVEVGKDVKNFKLNDKVIASCITSCNECYYCENNLQSHCLNGGGWILGHEIDGTQSEFVKIPYADHSLIKVPSEIPDESLLMLSDILPTGNEVGSISGNIKPNDIVVIVGSGPIGISVLLTSKVYKPKAIIMVDLDDERLRFAKEKLGADYVINSGAADFKEQLAKISKSLTNGVKDGADVAIECVGIPKTFEICQQIINPGGRIANVGVHGKPVNLELEKLWIRNINISTGLVSAYSTKPLLEKIKQGELNPKELVTHRFKFSDIEHAYDVFKHAAENKVIKTFIEFD